MAAMVIAMMTPRDTTSHPALLSLDAAASAARGGFACMFSSSDEYESALITQRRAQGHYAVQKRNNAPMVAFISACTAVVAAVAVYFARG